MRSWTQTAIALIGCWLLFHAYAVAQVADVTHCSPVSVRPGETVTFTIHGNRDWGEPLSLWTSFGAKYEFTAPVPDKPGAAPPKLDPKQLLVKLTLPSDAPCGPGIMRVCTALGLSEPFFIFVDELGSDIKKPNFVTFEKPQDITLPIGIDGFTDTRTPSYFRFSLKQGESVSVDVFAKRLLSRLDATVRLLDSAGKELASVDDTPALGGDCRIRYTATVDGPVLLEIRDVRYGGGRESFYYMRVGDFPLASVAFPPVAQAGSSVEWRAAGNFVDRLTPQKNALSPRPGTVASFASRWQPDKPATFVEMQSSSEAAVLEIEPNDKPEHATAIDPPCLVAGQFDAPGDRDRDVFQFPTKKNQRYRLSTEMRTLGSPGEIYFRIEGEKGELLAESDNTKNEEPVIEFTARTDGFARLVLEELNRRGGAEYVYAFRLTPQPAGNLELQAFADRLFVQKGGAATIRVSVRKRPGDEPITLELESDNDQPLPSYIKLEDNVIVKGKNETQMKVTFPAEVTPGTILNVRIVGRCQTKDVDYRAAAESPLLTNQSKSPLINLPRIPLQLRDVIAIGIGK